MQRVDHRELAQLHFSACCVVLYIGMWMGSGCAGSESTVGMTVRDSADVRIVENGVGDHRTAPIQLADWPVFRTGWRPLDYEFGRLSGGVLLADGSSIIVDQMANKAIILSPDGLILETVGASGEGPGEFGSMRRVVTLGGDSLALQDGYGGISLFVRDTFVKEIAVRDFHLTMLGRDDTHRIHLGPPRMVEPYPDGTPDRWIPLQLQVLDMESGVVQPFATIQYSLRTSGNIFSPQTMVAVSGGRVVVGRQDRPEIRWLDGAGEVAQIARWSTVAPRVANDSLWAVISNGYHSQWDGVIGRAAAAKRIELHRARSTGELPLFGEILGDSRGGVWLAEYTPYWSGPPSRYRVISPKGEWLGTVEVPEGFELFDVSDERVLGVERNELDVNAVAVYRIVSGDSGGGT